MSTATIETYPAKSQSASLRFLWKEYRVLRGFWLALAGLTIVGQLLFATLLAPPGSDVPTVLFGAALVAAALYAIGAAATQFSMEHEESTYQFLAGLPVGWVPLFFGKLALVAASTIGLVTVLCLSGWLISAGEMPRGDKVLGILATYGFAAVEGIAWGTLFSLLLKRPLVAALMAIVATTLGAQIIVSATVANSVATIYLDSYVMSLPARLLFVAALFAVDFLIARRWIGMAIDTPWRVFSRSESPPAAVAGQTSPEDVAQVPESWPSSLPCLLWQTWRESRWLFPLPLLVTCGLGFFVLLVMVLEQGRDTGALAFLAFTQALVFPALCGALAFYADQRGQSYQFFADHGVSARRIWFVRHLAWMCGTPLFACLVVFAFVVLFACWMHREIMEDLFRQRQWRTSEPVFGQLSAAVHIGYLFFDKVLFAPLAAYAFGQCFSMALRSGLMASFLAILLSVVVTAWLAVLLAWQLSGWLFLLPIAVGLLAATWLRAPAWLEGRNSIRAWVPSSIAVAASLLLIVLALPAARLGQIPNWLASRMAIPVSDSRIMTAAALAEGRETAAMYLEAAQMLEAPLENNPLADWLSGSQSAMGTDAYGYLSVDRIPESQREAFQAAQKEYNRLHFERLEEAYEIARRAGARPSCIFEFNFSSAALPSKSRRRYQNWQSANREYELLNALVRSMAYTPSSVRQEANLTNQDQLDIFLAGLRLCGRMRDGQPTFVFVAQLRNERLLLEGIANWTADPSVTTSQLRAALGELDKVFAELPHPEKSLLAERELVHKVVVGDQVPVILSIPEVNYLHYLAFLANELPWERERALRALDVFTSSFMKKIEYVRMSVADQSQGQPGRDDGQMLRQEVTQGLRSYDRFPNNPWLAAAQTSYLVAWEFDARVMGDQFLAGIVDAEVVRRAVRLQIGLGMYVRDHSEYPHSLAMLVPDYLPYEPYDPYSNEPFHYESRGLSLPLQRMGQPGSEHVEAGVPVMWSVGYGNARLYREQRDVPIDASDPDSETIDESVFWLRNEMYHRDLGSNDLVFPLPVRTESAE